MSVRVFLLSMVLSLGSAATPGQEKIFKYSLGAEAPNEKNFGGGAGGVERPLVTCEGKVATGFEARIGNYFDHLRLTCADLSENGRVSGSAPSPDTQGGGAGNTTVPAPCPAGYVLTGFQGLIGSYVNGLQGLCRDPREVGASEPGPASQITTNITPTNYGKGEGAPVRVECDAGQVVVEIHVRAGAQIDHLSFRCRALERHDSSPVIAPTTAPPSTPAPVETSAKEEPLSRADQIAADTLRYTKWALVVAVLAILVGAAVALFSDAFRAMLTKLWTRITRTNRGGDPP